MAQRQLTILFTGLSSWGHINPAHGLASALKERGHRVVFAVDKSFKDVLTPFGFEEIILEQLADREETYWQQFIINNFEYLLEEPIVNGEKFFLPAATLMFYDIKGHDKQYKEILNTLKPDVIITDNLVGSPTLNNSNIPWVWLMPSQPLYYLIDENLPPTCSGLPLNGNRDDWKQFRENWIKIFGKLQREVSAYYESGGNPKIEDNRLHPLSPHLNILYSTKELFYEDILTLPSNWIRVENILRITNQTFEIPEPLAQRSGKLILLSMGTLGCGILKLMIKLTTILAKSKHKFIVSKGPVFESHKLPDNMWGQRFLPQTAVLPKVDLVITHGGNNTINEIFYFGKPALVLPLFTDQLDNGQRVSETGLGLRLNPFHCTESELLSAVDRLVSDKALAERMTAIGHRIRNTNDKKFFAERIEQIFS